MTLEQVTESIEDTDLSFLIQSYNENKTKPADEKIKEVYEKAVSYGKTPFEARALIEQELKVTDYQIKKFIPNEARRRRQRTPGLFFPERSAMWKVMEEVRK